MAEKYRCRTCKFSCSTDSKKDYDRNELQRNKINFMNHLKDEDHKTKVIEKFGYDPDDYGSRKKGDSKKLFKCKYCDREFNYFCEYNNHLSSLPHQIAMKPNAVKLERKNQYNTIIYINNR